MNVHTSCNLFFVCLNILIFALVQSAFFYFIASKHYDKLVKDKLRIIPLFLNQPRQRAPAGLCKALKGLVNEITWVDTKGEQGIEYVPPDKEVEKLLSILLMQLKSGVMTHSHYLPGLTRSHFVRVTNDDGSTTYYRPEGKYLSHTTDEERDSENKKTLLFWSSAHITISFLLCIVFGIHARKELGKKGFDFKLVLACFSTELVFFALVFRTYQLYGDWSIVSKIMDKFE